MARYLEILLHFNPSALRVSRLFTLMLCCCHWMGCAWWFVSDLELSETNTPLVPANTWQPPADTLQSDLGNQFAASFFWGTGMVTVMLPYDIQPGTPVEVFVTSFCMFVSLMLNAFVIGSMASALSSMDSKKAISRGKIETIGAYLQIHSVPPTIRARILEFYECAAEIRAECRAEIRTKCRAECGLELRPCRRSCFTSRSPSLASTGISTRRHSRWRTCASSTTCRPPLPRASPSPSTVARKWPALEPGVGRVQASPSAVCSALLLVLLTPRSAARFTSEPPSSIARAPFFNVLSDSALLGVLAKLRSLIFVPGQVVMVEGQVSSTAPYLPLDDPSMSSQWPSQSPVSFAPLNRASQSPLSSPLDVPFDCR